MITVNNFLLQLADLFTHLCFVFFLVVHIIICLLQICDFGLAKWKHEAETQTKTRSRRGTVAYMAPEVFTDPSKSRTVKYDVYSFGILLCELLSEEKPFDDGTDVGCLIAGTVVIYCMICIHV